MSAQEDVVSVVDGNQQPGRAEASRREWGEENQASGQPEKGPSTQMRDLCEGVWDVAGLVREKLQDGEESWGGLPAQAPREWEGLGWVRQGWRGLAVAKVGLEERESLG